MEINKQISCLVLNIFECLIFTGLAYSTIRKFYHYLDKSNVVKIWLFDLALMFRLLLTICIDLLDLDFPDTPEGDRNFLYA